MHFLKCQIEISLQNAGLLLTIFFFIACSMPLLSLHKQIQFRTRRLLKLGQFFAQSFKSGDLSDEDELIMPKATCKMRAGCRVVATYKSKVGIACAEHAMEDMRPFTPVTRKRIHILDQVDHEAYISKFPILVFFFSFIILNHFLSVNFYAPVSNCFNFKDNFLCMTHAQTYVHIKITDEMIMKCSIM